MKKKQHYSGAAIIKIYDDFFLSNLEVESKIN